MPWIDPQKQKREDEQNREKAKFFWIGFVIGGLLVHLFYAAACHV